MNASQGSAEWLSERAGHATASRFKDVLARVKVGEAAGRRNYRMQLVTERLTGLPVEAYSNTAMAWGTEQEPYARMAYEAETGDLVAETAFMKHPTIPWCGASPDGLIDASGMAEIKCPFNSMVHVETLQGGMPSEHIPQIQGNLWVNGRAWCDFISFDPRMPEHLRLYVQRVPRDDAYIANLEEGVKAFLAEVESLYQSLMAKA